MSVEQEKDQSEAPHKPESSEIRYRRLFETAPNGIVILDAASAKITDANPFMVDLLGYSRDEFLGKELWQVGLFESEQVTGKAISDLLEKGFARYDNLPLQTKHGERREVEFVGNVYEEESRRVIQCNIRDITDRKAAEEELQEVHRRLMFHVDNTPLAVIEWDKDFRVSRWSPSAERMFGWKADEVFRKRITDWKFVFEDDIDAVEGIRPRQLRGAETHGVSRNRNYTSDGRVLYCEWYNSVLYDTSGALETILSLTLDVTA